MSVHDNYDKFLEHEAKQQRWLDSRPECGYCGKPIQDERLCDFDGYLLCPKCLEEHYMKDTEDYST